jgi:dynein heavy chain
MVSECIVILRGYKEVSWKSAKAMMSEGNFLKSLTEMDVDGITSGQVCHCTYTNMISGAQFGLKSYQ